MILSEAHVIEGNVYFVPALHDGAHYVFTFNAVHFLWETCYRTTTFLVYLARAHSIAELTQPLWGWMAKLPNQF